MCIRVSASTTLVFVAFSIENFVLPLCRTESRSQWHDICSAHFLPIRPAQWPSTEALSVSIELTCACIPCQRCALCTATDAPRAVSA